MKTIGEVLKDAREEKGISIDQIVHETNISREFIEALENELFDKFPAEIYLIGFLRNYSKFLDLDPDKAVGLYRNYKLSLEPTPIEELIGSNKKAVVRRYLIGGALAAVFIALVGFFGLPWFIDVIGKIRAERVTKIETLDEDLTTREIYPELPFWEGVVHPLDVVVLEDAAQAMVEGDTETGELHLLIVEAGEKLRIEGLERGEWVMRLGEGIHIPNSNGQPTWRIYLKDIGLIDGGAIIEIQELVSVAGAAGSAGLPNAEDLREAEIQKFREDARTTEPFVLDIVFQDSCLLRYRIDSNKTIEAYYSEGDSIRLDAALGVTLWGSNAGAIDVKIGEEKIELGRDGEVFVYVVTWINNEYQGTFDLFATPFR